MASRDAEVDYLVCRECQSPCYVFEMKDGAVKEAFCEICRKCAESCPSRSIPTGGRPTSRGFSHWSIDQESCYTFWRRIGTDCAVCIRSCPFTKPDTVLHRVVRWFIRRNPMNRRLALLADDLFYGRRPRIDPQKSRMTRPTLKSRL